LKHFINYIYFLSSLIKNMGGNQSTTQFSEVYNDLSIKQSAEISQDVKSNCSNSQSINFKDCDIEDSRFDLSSVCWLNQKAIQDAVEDTTANLSVVNDIENTAKTIAQSLDLNPGDRSINLYTSVANKLSMDQSNKIVQGCSSVSGGPQSVTCDGSTLKGVVVSESQVSQLMQDCSQTAAINQQASIDVDNAIKNDSYIKTEDTISRALITAGIATLLGGIGIMLAKGGGGGGGGKKPGGKVAIFIMLIVIGLYLYTECNGTLNKIPIINWLPHWCKTDNEKIWTVVIYISVVLFVIYFTMLRKESKDDEK
jgi:hypothetical protein